ncbi:unnamed protein product [Protopolystoma xenopodis]|uniref:Uncharacterized protein n=1 Tax=Protopolystoma xenopodis TaxID=117903 RepID=A0A448WJU6_9PLAT|nr:unnamed protein product [Protopolystoma xenopodis]
MRVWPQMNPGREKAFGSVVEVEKKRVGRQSEIDAGLKRKAAILLHFIFCLRFLQGLAVDLLKPPDGYMLLGLRFRFHCRPCCLDTWTNIQAFVWQSFNDAKYS